jgi:hypothetical protein
VHAIIDLRDGDELIVKARLTIARISPDENAEGASCLGMPAPRV